MVGAGGVLIEFLDDRGFALPPFDADEATAPDRRLALRPLLDGKRGAPPADIGRARRQRLARFSAMAADLAGLVAEIDVNPVIAGPDGPVALDALVVAAQRAG